MTSILVAMVFVFNISAQAQAPSISHIQDVSLENAYVIAFPALYSKKLPAGKIPEWTKCSCVEFAKWYLGRQGESWGNARDMKPTSDHPYVGGLVLTTEGDGHVAVIIEILGDSIRVADSNYEKCKQTERIIRLDSKVIRGFK